ncbi:hypothetical protein [Amycolatopsis sp. FDAARGOS 1241]|uniref:hypothetical protein n=1 Tax=Amycolatopsis sp. FDAARGOS 1241 TaxID=2778070 RepID=UPI0019526910|nr:hypothetical protein [Amycolatopsis sp. FDAARGOS 1241]QRP46992.1 hypothetical protein I6J71_02820 [Amycolatopsis sp. FDAARGOS 1241]
MTDVHRVEATVLRPGDVGDALRDLRRHARNPRRLEAHRVAGCPCGENLIRWTLETVLQALPGRSRAALRALIKPLDDEFRRRTVLDPSAPPEWPWWQRRVTYSR